MKRTTKIMAALIAGLLLFALVPAAALAAREDGTACQRLVPPSYFIKSVIPRVPGTGTLIVTDAEGAPVAGAEYDLYRVNPYGGKDTKIGATYKTDKNGKILVSHLPYGDFYWVAASEVKGFAADEEKHEFKIVGTAFVTTEVELELPAPEPEPEPAIAEETAEEEAAIADEAAEEVAVVADEAAEEAEAVIVIDAADIVA